MQRRARVSRPSLELLWSTGLSIAGIIVVLVATHRYGGAGIDPDSVDYIACARNLLSGIGLLDHEGLPFTKWPPLFPLLLAALGAVGVDPLQGGRLLNAAAFGLSVFVTGQFLRFQMCATTLVILGTCLLYTSPSPRDS